MLEFKYNPYTRPDNTIRYRKYVWRSKIVFERTPVRFPTRVTNPNAEQSQGGFLNLLEIHGTNDEIAPFKKPFTIELEGKRCFIVRKDATANPIKVWFLAQYVPSVDGLAAVAAESLTAYNLVITVDTSEYTDTVEVKDEEDTEP